MSRIICGTLRCSGLSYSQYHLNLVLSVVYLLGGMIAAFAFIRRTQTSRPDSSWIHPSFWLAAQGTIAFALGVWDFELSVRSFGSEKLRRDDDIVTHLSTFSLFCSLSCLYMVSQLPTASKLRFLHRSLFALVVPLILFINTYGSLLGVGNLTGIHNSNASVGYTDVRFEGKADKLFFVELALLILIYMESILIRCYCFYKYERKDFRPRCSDAWSQGNRFQAGSLSHGPSSLLDDKVGILAKILVFNLAILLYANQALFGFARPSSAVFVDVVGFSGVVGYSLLVILSVLMKGSSHCEVEVVLEEKRQAQNSREIQPNGSHGVFTVPRSSDRTRLNLSASQSSLTESQRGSNQIEPSRRSSQILQPEDPGKDHWNQETLPMATPQVFQDSGHGLVPKEPVGSRLEKVVTMPLNAMVSRFSEDRPPLPLIRVSDNRLLGSQTFIDRLKRISVKSASKRPSSKDSKESFNSTSQLVPPLIKSVSPPSDWWNSRKVHHPANLLGYSGTHQIIIPVTPESSSDFDAGKEEVLRKLSHASKIESRKNSIVSFDSIPTGMPAACAQSNPASGLGYFTLFDSLPPTGEDRGKPDGQVGKGRWIKHGKATTNLQKTGPPPPPSVVSSEDHPLVPTMRHRRSQTLEGSLTFPPNNPAQPRWETQAWKKERADGWSRDRPTARLSADELGTCPQAWIQTPRSNHHARSNDPWIQSKRQNPNLAQLCSHRDSDDEKPLESKHESTNSNLKISNRTSESPKEVQPSTGANPIAPPPSNSCPDRSERSDRIELHPTPTGGGKDDLVPSSSPHQAERPIRLEEEWMGRKKEEERPPSFPPLSLLKLLQLPLPNHSVDSNLTMKRTRSSLQLYLTTWDTDHQRSQEEEPSRPESDLLTRSFDP
ncbi:hypothetical protein IE53DRAFT_370430 [Violaceomyces palustris]|uniref:Uncharacterized protein n=1 Tax=Violaceomyces palustris TaxID=1673888 RepID=A0ACD0NSB8_9BASI|nr:hypothetical protein IE53DRAFT_370430 [Violaceomyces palustris]